MAATPILITPLQRLALEATYGATPAARAAAHAQIAQIQAQQQAPAAQERATATQRATSQAAASRTLEDSVRRTLADAGATIGGTAQQHPQAESRVQARPSTSGGRSLSVHTERPYAPPAQSAYETSGIRSAHSGHQEVTTWRAAAPSPAAGRFQTTNVERRPDGSMSVTVIPK
jgi:hypothetical protein